MLISHGLKTKFAQRALDPDIATYVQDFSHTFKHSLVELITLTLKLSNLERTIVSTLG